MSNIEDDVHRIVQTAVADNNYFPVQINEDFIIVIFDMNNMNAITNVMNNMMAVTNRMNGRISYFVNKTFVRISEDVTSVTDSSDTRIIVSVPNYDAV